MGKYSSHRMPAFRYRRFYRTILLAGILLIAPATAMSAQSGGALPAAESQRTGIHVMIEQGLLTVDLRDAPLAEVLQAIAEKASFRLTLRGDLSTPVTRSFTGVPLTKGIERLVGDNSLVMTHAPANEASLLLQVWVRAPGKRTVMFEPNPSPDPAVYQNGDRPERTAQRRAARQLAGRGDGAAADELVSLLAQDSDPVVRTIAAGGLGNIGGERAIGALKAALVDEDGSVRKRAIFELGRIGKDEVAEALAEVLGADPDADIRQFAARALARLNSMAARFALEAALADSENIVREAAGAALAKWQSSFDDSD